jgi:hypothetical protein
VSESAGDPVEHRATAYELAFVEAGRALDAQERAVNELRSRAGVLIAAAAVATSFFGGGAMAGENGSPGMLIAIVAFVLVGIAVLAVLWPRPDWEFGASAQDLIAEYVEPESVPLPLIHRDLALHRTASFATNAAQLRWLVSAFRFGLVLLVIEVGAWLVALTERT